MPSFPFIDEWDYLTTNWGEIYYTHDVQSVQRYRYKTLVKALRTFLY